MTNSGPMREVIRFERKSSSQDDSGEQMPVWTLVAERRAEKMQMPGREVWSSKQRAGRIPTVFRIRFPKEFTVEPQMRLIHKSRVYDITSAYDEDGREVNLLVTCDELVGEPK